MNLQELLNSYRQVAQQLPEHPDCELSLGIIQIISSQTTTDLDDLWNQLRKFQPQQGWMTLQSRIIPIFDGALPKHNENVLSAELCNGEESFYVKYIGPAWHYCWSTVSITNDPGNANCLVQDKRYLCRLETNGKKMLVYQCCWQPDNSEDSDEQGLSIRFSRFVGFKE